jgi:hypothetical protein
LASGTFDVGVVLKILSELGWQGSSGMRHFGIAGDAKANLEHSMDSWCGLLTEMWSSSRASRRDSTNQHGFMVRQ